MEVHSEIMNELWRIKDELSAGYKSFHEYFQCLLKWQAESHPEFSSVAASRACDGPKPLIDL